ncbi:hypothetical protein [Herbiconiux daphne]|uniref:Integral membrane protein n=1 Tax=Herbiconiux daphne TaxID=2970914 RepID=A0ABT2H410_9MICO|nr:hypothetical protein [Herbiconiux daphne]MCS5734669.1 hypothetical protein [Herbiconiux daphne]
MREKSDRDVDRAAESWLRREGLPYFVRARAWGDRLTIRIAPFILFVLLADLSLTILLTIDFDVDTDDPAIGVLLFALVLIVLLAALVLPIVLSALASRVLRRFPRARLPVALGLLGLFVVVVPVAELFTSPVEDFVTAFVGDLLIVGLAYLFTWLGIGSLVAWAVRSALRQVAAIGTLTTRALPILMLVVVFAFFARPLWEVTSTMSAGRLFAVAVFFVVLGLLFVIPITHSEMHGLEQRIDRTERIEAVRSTRLPGLEERAAAGGPRLSRFERFNFETVFVLALGFQVFIFAVLVCVFLLALGVLAFSAEVLEEWVGARATTLSVLGIELPFTWALVKTSIFLSCVSSLNFLVSVTTNSAYRAKFYDPLFREARTALSVRSAYRATAGAPVDVEADAEHAAPSGPAPISHPGAPIPHGHSTSPHPGEVEHGMIEPGRGSE